jgi:hypothetical protein
MVRAAVMASNIAAIASNIQVDKIIPLFLEEVMMVVVMAVANKCSLMERILCNPFLFVSNNY